MSTAVNDGNGDSHIFFRTNGTNVVISEEWVLPVPVANAYTLVSFNFQTTGGDINFSMVFIGLSGEEEVLIAPHRVQSDAEPVHEALRLGAPGTLILLWDNSYSWLHKKELSYSLQIEQDPELDANGLPKEVPLSQFEEARVESSKQQQKALLAHMSHLRHRLGGVEDILRTVSTSEIEELEQSLVRIREEIAMKKNLLHTSRAEKKEVQRLLRDCDRFRDPLNIRTLSGKTLSHVLQYLDGAESSLVCKYWCQVTAYINERRDNPDLTDDDFEILFDYESRGDNSVNQEQRPQSRGDSRRSNYHDDNGNQDVADQEGGTPSGGASLNTTDNSVSQSQSHSDVPGGGDPSLSLSEEVDVDEADQQQPMSSPSLKAVLQSVSQAQKGHGQGQRQHRQNSPGPKKLNLADYPEDIKQFLRASLATMSRMEGEKVEIRGRIDQWKLNFERRHRRPPSDYEKLTNISTFFQKYSKLKRAIKVEEEKIFKIANAIDKLQG